MNLTQRLILLEAQAGAIHFIARLNCRRVVHRLPQAI